jgi:hypothetical protein
LDSIVLNVGFGLNLGFEHTVCFFVAQVCFEVSLTVRSCRLPQKVRLFEEFGPCITNILV